MTCKGSSLRLFALCNKYIQQHAADEEEEQDASLTALYLFCCTEKSLSLPSLFAPANAHSLLHRHRVATMERLKHATALHQAGQAAAASVSPGAMEREARRLAKLAAELRQGSPSHLRKVHSPRTAQQICKMLKLGDAAYSAWEEWQRAQPGGRNGGRRAAASPSPRKQPKRKSPSKPAAGLSRFSAGCRVDAAAAGSPAAGTAAAGEAADGQPPRRRRTSSEEESELAPKQLFCGGGGEGEGELAGPGSPGKQQQQQPAPEWLQFKAFLSPRRPVAGGAAAVPMPAPPLPAAAAPCMGEQPAAPSLQPMAVDSLPAAVCSPPLAAKIPLSPRQARPAGLPPAEVTPIKQFAPWRPACEKENGCSAAWDCPSPTDAMACSPVAAPGAGAGWHPAAVDQTLVLQSPAAKHSGAAWSLLAAEVIAADVMMLLSESSLTCSSLPPPPPISRSGSRGRKASVPVRCCSPAGHDMEMHSCSSSPGDSPAGQTADAPEPPAGRQEQQQAQAQAQEQAQQEQQLQGRPGRRVLRICAGDRVFDFDRAAVRQHVARAGVHAGGTQDAHATHRSLNDCGRAHSILKPVSLPLLGASS